MKKIVFNILETLLFIVLVVFSSYFFGAFGGADYNKTMIADVIKTLNGTQNYMFLNLDTESGTYSNWTGFTKPYNSDFLAHSAAIRISNESFIIQTQSNKELSIHVTDLHISNIYNNPRYNYSLLDPDPNTKVFEDNSIVLKREMMDALSLSIGDVVSFSGANSFGIDLTVVGTYFSGGRYANAFYYEVVDSACFVSQKVFDAAVSDGYKGYLGISNKENKYKDAYWTEISPFIQENNIKLSIDDKYSQNNITIDDLDVLEYQAKLDSRFNIYKHSIINILLRIPLAFSVAIGIIGVSLSLCFGYKRLNKTRLVYISVFTLIFVGFGMLIAKFGPFLFGLLIKNGLTYSFVSALQSLTIATIAAISVSLFYSLYQSHFDRVINSYEKLSQSSKNIFCNIDNLISNSPKKTIMNVNEVFKTKKVLFFGSFVSPDSSAGAIRVMNYAKIVAKGGYTAYISSFMNEYAPGAIYKYSKGIYLMPYAKAPKTKREKAHLYLNPKKEVSKVLKRFENNLPSCILVYSVFPLPGIRVIRKFCKKYNVKLVFDVVESHSITQQKFTSLFATYIPNKIQNKLVIKKGDNVIGISSYLCNKFKDKGCNVLQIPFINNVSEFRFKEMPMKEHRNKDFKKCFLYVGNPSCGKDLLTPVINVFSELNKNQATLLIAGVDAKGLVLNEKLTGDVLLNSVPNVVVLGKIPHAQIPLLYSIADYSILIRNPNKESAKAGFPTKVSESLAYGVPVVANITTDLGTILNDSNSVIVTDLQKESIKDAILKASTMNYKRYGKMRIEARNTATNELSVLAYKEDFIKFVLK